MADDKQTHEIVARFDYGGEPIVLSESDDGITPMVQTDEARVEVDPLVEEFARRPYDPVIGAMMMGRATGEVIAHPPRIGWMRVISYLLAIGMIAQLIAVFYFAIDAGRFGIGASLPSTGLALVMAAGGVLLLRRLLRG